MLSFPSEHGQVIYQSHEDRPDQLYIIGISHRDTLTGVNGSDTVKAQTEVYRIGDWLIRNKGLELLLPEGFFINSTAVDKKDVSAPEVPQDEDSAIEPFGSKELEDMLGGNNVQTNAEMLLIKSHGITSLQVEDFDLYTSVQDRVIRIEKNRNNLYASLMLRSELDYLQEKRTAVMLQKIPDIIISTGRAGLKVKRPFLP